MTNLANACCVPPPADLVSRWPGDGHSADTEGSNDGSLLGGAYTAGRVSQGFSLDGFDDYVSVADDASLDLASQLTITAWIYPTQVSGLPRIVTKWGNIALGTGGYAFFINNGHLEAQLSSNGSDYQIVSGGTLLKENSWYHAAFTYDGTEMRLYLNGSLDGSAARSGQISQNDRRLMIGAQEYSNGSWAPFFKGKIDDVGLYSRALSDVEVQDIFAAAGQGICDSGCLAVPSNLVSWWPGDGSPADIHSVNEGSLQGGTTFTSGMVSQSLLLDGVDDYVSVPDSGSLDISGPMTISAWIKADSVLGQPRLVAKWGDIASSSGGYAFFIRDGRLEAQLSSTGNDYQIVSGSTLLQQGTWYHVAFTYDGSQMRLYLNAGLDGAAARSGSVNTNNKPLLIGAQEISSGLTYFFHGTIDEIQIFSKALTASELQTIVDAGAAGQCK